MHLIYSIGSGLVIFSLIIGSIFILYMMTDGIMNGLIFAPLILSLIMGIFLMLIGTKEPSKTTTQENNTTLSLKNNLQTLYIST
jgi:vacuolar-type H+-ATPase subunit I/STV1